MTRIAIKKFSETGELENERDAVDKLWKDFLYPHQQETYLSSPFFYDQQKWRATRYWNEPCDNIFKAYSHLFHFLFTKYGGLKPDNANRVDIEEFTVFIQDAGILNDKLTRYTLPICFAQALQL